MIYPFECQSCGARIEVDSRPLHPPAAPVCCDVLTTRIFGCLIDTSKCRDASDIPDSKRVVRGSVIDGKKIDPVKEERRFRKHIDAKRDQLRGKQNGSIRHTHSVPADLYHGKIRETGDKNYWQDQSNVNRHKDCKVS